MASNNRTLLVELDFDTIKQNLITFFQSQPVFQGFNFAGAGINQLMNILAYNTHYNGLMVNMLSNEIFPVTAQIRDNIVTGAKSLGYVPKSMAAPVAFVNVTVTPPAGNNNATLLMPRYTPFTSTAISGVNYPFVTPTSYVASLIAGQYVFTDVQLVEGIPLNFTFLGDSVSNPRSEFNLPSANIDVSTIIINVTEYTPSPAQTWPYVFCTDITNNIDGNSRVYFLEADSANTYTVYFGDGIIGRQINSGDIVNIQFIATDGELANYANTFAAQAPIGGFGNTVVQSLVAASGGAPPETNDSIRFNAPNFFIAQNRAVTKSDYWNLLLRNYPNLASVSVWGGEENIPPVYGKVFISIKPIIGNYLTTLQKQNILDTILSDQSMVTVIPTIVDADFTYMNFNLNVYYNTNLTTLSQPQLMQTVINAVLNYGSTQLGKFTSVFEQTAMEQAIINSERSFLSVDTTIYLQKRFFPTLGQSKTYTLNYFTPLLSGGPNDKLFTLPSFSIFDNAGMLQQCFMEENEQTYSGISQINVINPGFNYTTATVQITGDGTGATASAVIVNGAIQSIVLTNPGQGYSIATATITGDGFNALATVVVGSSAGQLETFYFTNNNKYFVSTNQGSVDHTKGVITVGNFAPIDISNPQKMLSVYIQPQSSVIVPARNNILLIDPTDPLAITVTLTPITTL